MRIKLVYETQTGTTLYVAEVLQRELESLGHQVVLHSLRYQGMEPTLNDTDVIIFGAPTYDDGLLEKVTREWITVFHPDLSAYKVAIFGLGNRTYPQFCRSADLLEAWVRQNNGTPIIETLRVDHFPDDLTPIVEWASELNTALASSAQTTAGVPPLQTQ